jgi:membrane protein YdbS with pleckstrin-like domain
MGIGITSASFLVLVLLLAAVVQLLVVVVANHIQHLVHQKQSQQSLEINRGIFFISRTAAGLTGLEPATSSVTGKRSNQTEL